MRPVVFWCLMAYFLPGLCEEIHVLSGGAAKAFLEPATASFAGHAVKIDYQPMGRVVQTMGGAERARYDLLVVTADAADRLKLKGAVPLARVGIGIAVREGAPVPDVSTPDALRRTLLAAKSIVHINPATGTSGRYVVELFKKLGIYEEIKSKTTLVDSGAAAAPVARGEAELAIHQVSEILPVKGVKLAGPLPAELQRYTVYNAVPLPASAHAAAVSEYIGHLTGAQARAGLAAAGYSEP